MDSVDGAKFLALINVTSDYYKKPPLSDPAVRIYFNALEPYGYKQVEHAIGKHISATNGGWMPMVSDIIRHIDGGQITSDQVIAAARLKETPLGVLCAIQIGSFDLNSTADMFYLRQRAEECIQKMPEWKHRGLMGAYSEHEVSIMLKHHVSPLGPFSKGLPQPGTKSALAERVARIKGSKRHKFLLGNAYIEGEKNLAPSKNVSDFIDKL